MPNYSFTCKNGHQTSKIVAWGTQHLACPQCTATANRDAKLQPFSFRM